MTKVFIKKSCTKAIKKKKSIKIDLLHCAKTMIQQADIQIIPGQAYTIYECGHVFEIEKDPQTLTFYRTQNREIRSCPLCKNAMLITKYKQCGCGAEHIGKRVVSSVCCGQCPTERRPNAAPLKLKHLRNAHLADPERCFCIHRAVCMEKYIDYDTIPCKDCLNYQPDHGRHDPIYTRL